MEQTSDSSSSESSSDDSEHEYRRQNAIKLDTQVNLNASIS